MLSVAERIACLRKTELFSGMSNDALGKIAGVAQEMYLADDKTIFHDGEKGDAVYFVVEGEVKAHRFGIEITRIGKDNCVGEMGVIDEGPRSGSVSSIGDTVLLKVSRDDFYRVAKNDLKLLQNVLKIVLRKLRRDTDRQIDTIREHERTEQDLLRAREMQMSMLPTQDLHVEPANCLCLKASGNCSPAEKVGGDYYDYFSLPDDQVGLVIGDVEGHGFHTGLMVAMAKSCLQVQMKTDHSIPSVMSALEDMVNGFMQSEHSLYMTFCYIIADLREHTISFCNAGHNYPYHYRAATGELDVLESNAHPLGLLVSILGLQEFEASQSEWGAGDVFVLYSDGIIEAEDENGELFGKKRLEQLIKENAYLPPDQLKEKILREFDSFCHGAVQVDDVSLVAIKMGA
jgi:serine phosphatase RsbU (regulator of sigma subunit)